MGLELMNGEIMTGAKVGQPTEPPRHPGAPIWNLFLIMICDGSQVSTFPCRYQIDPGPFITMTVLSLQPSDAISVMN